MSAESSLKVYLREHYGNKDILEVCTHGGGGAMEELSHFDHGR